MVLLDNIISAWYLIQDDALVLVMQQHQQQPFNLAFLCINTNIVAMIINVIAYTNTRTDSGVLSMQKLLSAPWSSSSQYQCSNIASSIAPNIGPNGNSIQIYHANPHSSMVERWSLRTEDAGSNPAEDNIGICNIHMKTALGLKILVTFFA